MADATYASEDAGEAMAREIEDRLTAFLEDFLKDQRLPSLDRKGRFMDCFPGYFQVLRGVGQGNKGALEG